MSDLINLNFTVNGEKKHIKLDPSMTLLEILRNILKLTGTKEGCGKGECGSCTVLLNGKAVNACLVIASQLEEAEIITIEGLGKGEEIHPIQKAFIEEGAVQCGFCIPGMIMSAKALLDENPHPSEEEIKWGISGNLCRCTGYSKIVSAIEKAAKER
ncbi:MAG TPA: (2Fe-2S)-binding protein [Candidatus Eremiobacteraeota bacterium]|nr:MAG: Nicotinate dehydrogenase small FeS subunit [bacterium ADurb.Bin363]HPZ07310.1 (2Fe-2S)-binding protein [Candidatus Eremiobacteraeota bacterium]